MNVWLIGATVLVCALAPCLFVTLTASVTDAFVALQLAVAVATLALVLLAEGFHRSSYFTVPLVLVGTAFVGSLLYAKFLGRWL